jgi:hypothetical protein
MTSETTSIFSIRDTINFIVDEYARRHKPAAGQLGLFEKPEERQKPLFSKSVDDEAGRWVTMRGARVYISNDDGRIMKGPKKLIGKTKEQIEKESAGEEDSGKAPKPKPLNEMGRISGGRADNRQKKLFEELNPGFKFEDDEEEDFKTVEPVSSSPAEDLTRPEWDQKVRDDIRSIMGEVDYDNADIDRLDGIDAIDRAVGFAHDNNRNYGNAISGLNDKWIDSMPESSAEESGADDESPEFTLDSTPAPSPAKPEDFGKSESTKQGALFDTGKGTGDLKGQELLFNSDAGDLNNPKTMENRAKSEIKTIDEMKSMAPADLQSYIMGLDSSFSPSFRTEDWGRLSRGQGKRVGGMVMGGMSSAPTGKKTYIDDRWKDFPELSSDEKAELSSLVQGNDNYLTSAYYKARTAGLNHDQAASFLAGMGDFKGGQVLSDLLNETGEFSESKQDDGPQDGDTNEIGLTFRNGRWHRDGEEINPADIAAKARENGESIWTAAKRELGLNSMGEIPPELRKELGDAMAATSAGKAPEVKPPSPGRQRAMERQEEKQQAEESPVPVIPAAAIDVPAASEPPAPVKPATTRGGVKDFGEYIPGARKERAKKLGPRETKEDSDGEKEKKPGWKNRYSVSEIASSSTRSEVGKFHVTDSRSKDYFGQNKSLGVFNTREEAEAAIPQLEVNRNHSIRRLNEGQPKDQAEWDKYVEAKNAWAKRFETSTAEEARNIPFPDRPERVGEEYAIVRNVSDKKRPTVKGGFSSQAEAEKWMKENPESIIEHQFPSYETYQYLDRVERSGPEFRKSNVDPEDFQKAFKTHGGQFGKWNSGKDGQTSLNHAYDSFHDLADVLGVAPEAVSLNGKLAMAFGARGTGGKDSARAHYEPGLDVINLTKMKGAGSLAHEWAHALDFGIAKETNQGRKELSGATAIQEKFLKTRPEVREALKNLTDAMFTTDVELKKDAGKEGKAVDRQKEAIRTMVGSLEKGWTSTYGKKKKPLDETESARWNELKERLVNGDMGEVTWKSSDRGYGGRYSSDLLEEMNGMHKKVTGRSFMTNDDNSAGKNIYWAAKRLQDAEGRLKEAQSSEVKTGRTRSSFMNEAIDLDGTSKGDYYTQPEEMFARAFESYVHDKLESSGRRSDYLIGKGKTDNRVYRAFGMPGPFPEGEERKKINAAFDNFFEKLRGNELKAAEKKSGGVEKYSRTSYNVAASEAMHTIVDRYCQDEPVMVDKYAHPLIHAAVGAGAMALANKAFRSGPLRSVAHAAIAAAMSAWMSSAMAANGVQPSQAPSSPDANAVHVSPAASPFMNQQAGNNVVNQIVQNAINQNAAKAQAAATAPPSPAQVSAHSISSAAAGKAGVPGVRPLTGGNAVGIPGRVQVVTPASPNQSQSAGKEGAESGKLPVTEPADGSGSGSFNADHPRHPAGATGSKGGEFAPKGEGESGSSSDGSSPSAPETSSSPAVGDSPDESPSPRNYPDNLNKPASEQTDYSPPERSIDPPKIDKPIHTGERQSRKAAWEQHLKGVSEMIVEKKESAKAEKKQAKELAKATSFNPAELSSPMADDIEPIGEAPKEEDFDSAKDYENALEKHNRSKGAKQATIKKRSSADLIPEIAGQYDLDHSTLQQAVDDEIQMLLPYHNRKEEARQYISKMGWNARRINQAEDRGMDSDSGNFDYVASQWAGMFPEIAGSDESEWVAKMWDLSKEGAQDPPSASDEELVNRVAKRLSESGASSSSAEEEGFEYADAGPVSGQPGDVDYTPFHRKAVVDLIVDRYMRLAGIA